MKDNKLIAEFTGLELEETLEGLFVYARKEQSPIKLNDIKTEFYEVHELQYHTSWDWLMPVVEKIEDDDRYDVEIVQYGTRITDNQKEIVNNIANISFDKKIEHTYNAVVQFINQYNKTNDKG